MLYKFQFQRLPNNGNQQMFREENVNCHKMASTETTSTHSHKKLSEKEIAELLETLNSDCDDTDSDPHYEPDNDKKSSSDDPSSEEENEELDTGTCSKVKKSRKRKRNLTVTQTAKCKRNKGEKYKSKRGKGTVVVSKSVGECCNCSLQCFENVPHETRNAICEGFWKLGNFDAQNSYIFACLRSTAVLRQTKKNASRRSQTITYTVKVNKEHVRVCKPAFLALHGLQNNRGRVENIVRKLKIGAVIPQSDQRGKHANHARKYDDTVIRDVKQFIDSIPRYQSHYRRNNSPCAEYISLEHSITSIYQKYVEECTISSKQAVSSDKFRRIFTEEFNLHFKLPHSDTCAKCDSLHVAIHDAKLSGKVDQERRLLGEQELHHRKAEAARGLIKQSILLAKSDPNVHTITFDLQQALPTPKLTTGPCFYKRKVFCYNLGVHDCGAEEGHFFVWDESVAKRGAEEISSCLLRYFEENNIKGEKLIAISDNCGGQNKNWTLVTFWLYLIQIGRFQTVTHIFPVVGHTMLASDRDFAVVERNVRDHYQQVYSPDHWEYILRTSKKKKAFKTLRMNSEHFFSFNDLRNHFQQARVHTDGTQFTISTVTRYTLMKDKPLLMYCATNYTGDLVEVSLKKRGRCTGNFFDMIHVLNKKYAGLLPIDSNKLKDVMTCLQWIPPIYHQWYYTLTSASGHAPEQTEDE